jgi:hypothetical protein
VLTVAKLNTLVHWISSELNQLYDSIFTKLIEENEEDEDYHPVHQILMWVVLAARPLTLAELRQALAISLGTGSLYEDDLTMKKPLWSSQFRNRLASHPNQWQTRCALCLIH